MNQMHATEYALGSVVVPDRPIPIFAPLAGWLTPLADVPDPVFSELILGNGVAVDPTESVLKAPCDGEILALHSALHAITLKLANGAELLLHIGIDTVTLAGKGFVAHVQEGQTVKAGDPLVSFDMDFLVRQGKCLLVPIIVTSDGFTLSTITPNHEVKSGDALYSIASENGAPGEAVGTFGHPEQTAEFRIVDPSGIHARPAGLIAECAKRHRAKVVFSAHGKEADARSPVKLMLLGLNGGDLVRVTAQGEDRDVALAALQALLATLGGDRTVEVSAAPTADTKERSPLQTWPAGHHATIKGVQAVSGLAVGKAIRVLGEQIQVSEQGEDPSVESRRLRQALEIAREDLAEEIESSRLHNQQQAEILKAHLSFLDDLDLIDKSFGLIDLGKSAGFAWKSATEQQATALRRLGNARLAERAVDLLDVEQRVLMALSGKTRSATNVLPVGSIVLADDLLPSQLVNMDTLHIAGLCLAEGGPTSHVAILAASLGIPTLVAMGPDVMRAPEGASLILDADHQRLAINPPDDELAQTTSRLERRRFRVSEAKAHAGEECFMADGERIEVVANLASPTDALTAVANGAEGCGLLRSEFLFLDRDTAPSEEEQLAQYQAVADALDGRPLVIRTLDAGADKVLPYLDLPPEVNPALGLRGVRTSLWKPETLRTQLRAVLRVRPCGQCRVMVPMISTLDELREVRAILEQERQSLGITEPMPLGVMVEVPSVALMANAFARECDFFSIGTNDLTQYTLAMDRMSPHLAQRADALNPSILLLIGQTATAAAEHERWTSVCGGLASVPLAAPVLIGLGVRKLSATASSIPEIKAMIRALTLAQCRAIAQEALRLDTAEAVRHLLVSHWPEA